MKVFISWSGERSKALANALREWLPMVLQYVEPWVSDKDISAGDRWAQAIAGELESSNFGIICITPENLNSEWILFESGALSKSMLDGKVIPLLLGLELSDLSGPLSQFQAQKVEETGIMEVVRSINKVADKKASEQIVSQLVPTLWPKLKETLDNIPSAKPSGKHMRPQHEILEELVTGVRGLNSRIREFDPDEIERGRYPRRRKWKFHPHMLEEFAMISSEDERAPISLLLLAGLMRDDLPWLAELLTESYREIRDSEPNAHEKIFRRLVQSIMRLTHSPMAREFGWSSKEALMMAEDLPMFLDMTLGRMIERSARKPAGKDETEG